MSSVTSIPRKALFFIFSRVPTFRGSSGSEDGGPIGGDIIVKMKIDQGLLTIAYLFLSVAGAAPGSWSSLYGNEHTSWIDNVAGKPWRTSAKYNGSVDSPIAVTSAAVLTWTDGEGEPGNYSPRLSAFDPATGKSLWRKQLPARWANLCTNAGVSAGKEAVYFLSEADGNDLSQSHSQSLK